jgi:hypothetical protein
VTAAREMVALRDCHSNTVVAPLRQMDALRRAFEVAA